MPNIEGISLWINSFLYCLKHTVPVRVAYKIPRILSAFHLIVVKTNPNQLLTIRLVLSQSPTCSKTKTKLIV